MTTLQATAATKKSRRCEPQPLHVVQLEDALLKLQTVRATTGLSTSSIYRLEKLGELMPVRIGARCTRWPAASVRAFMAKATSTVGA